MRFLLLIGLVALASCGSGGKKGEPVAPSLGNQVEVEELVPSPPGSNPVRHAPPAGFTMPSFAPLYPGATIQSVDGAADGSVHEIRLVTTDDAAKVASFYRDRFAAAGMQKTSDFQSGGTAMMSAMGGGRQASIAIAKQQKHNEVIVTYSGE